MILVPTNRRIIRPGDKPSFEHTQRYGLIKNHPLGPAGGLIVFPIMNEGSGLTVHDLSGNRQDGTCVGTAPSWRAGRFGSAVLLPGTDEYIDCGNSAIHGWGSGDGTVIIWFKMIVVPGESLHDYLVCRGRTHANGKRYYIETYNSTPTAPAHLYAGIDDNDVGGAAVLDEQDSIYPGINYCVALVRDGNTLRLYKNAIQVDSADITGYGAIDDGTFPNLIIGARHRADTSLIDAFSNVRIEQTVNYNRALSITEIASVYWNPFCMVEKKTAPVYFFVPVVPVGGLSNVTELQLLEHLVGKTPFSKPTAYIGFCTADPGEDATGGSCNEVANTNGYERIATAIDDWGNASTGAIENVVALASPYATGSWGEITHFVLVDSPTYGEGKVLAYDALDASKTIEDKDNLEFAIGDLAFTLN